MKRGSTVFLKSVVILIAIITLALCIFWLPPLVMSSAAKTPALAYLRYPFLAYVYLGAIPFFVALYQAFKLLGHIDAGRAFSEASVSTLKYIKYCAVAIISLIVLGGLYATLFTKAEKAHVIEPGLLFTFTSSIIATFAAVLEKLLQTAVDIKSENDLTV